MDVAIGLPNTVPGTDGQQLTEWARRADEAGFSSLGTIDRIVFPNLEPLTALGAAAAVTERIGLATTILLAPLRTNTALFAKQAASVQKLSGGRLTLGIAVGGREDDYEASGVEMKTRGKVFDEQLDGLREIWAASGDRNGTVGPDVSGDPPRILIGGSVDAAFRRAAEHGVGWIMGGGTPEMFAEGRAKVDAAWNEVGREGRARGAALAYFALGESAEADAQAYLGDYYAFLGEIAQALVDSAAKDPDTVRAYLQAFADAGCDELFFMPTSSDPAQVDLLAEAALG
jgi:alkanesulfonate monooxygenase SsuD/methylene tetrahydromethanopterin reductase-like flavin-dependent oxidoreductase (luciferase family)